MAKFIRFRVAFLQHRDDADSMELAAYEVETAATFVEAIDIATDHLILDGHCPSVVDAVLCDIIGDSKTTNEIDV